MTQIISVQTDGRTDIAVAYVALCNHAMQLKKYSVFLVLKTLASLFSILAWQ